MGSSYTSVLKKNHSWRNQMMVACHKWSVQSLIINSWFHWKIYEEHHEVSASKVHFLKKIDTFLLPVNFVISVRSPLSPWNVIGVNELSIQSRKKKDKNFWPLITKSQNLVNEQILMYSRMTAPIDLVKWQSHLLSTAISSYHYLWMKRCERTDNLTSLSYKHVRKTT